MAPGGYWRVQLRLKIWDSLSPVELCGREGLTLPGGCVQLAWEGLLISVSRQGGDHDSWFGCSWGIAAISARTQGFLRL